MITNAQLLRDLADAASPPIAIYTGINLKISFINKAMKNFWNTDNAQTYFDLLPEGIEIFGVQALHALSTGKTFHCENKEIKLQREKKDIFHYLNYSFIPLKDESGNIYGVLNTQTDITELNNIKEMADLNMQELKRSNFDLLHFADTVSHDLREPIRKINIYNAYLQKEIRTGQSEKSKLYHRKIEQSAKRMEDIIEGVLHYSALNREKQPLKKIKLNKLFASILIDLELIAKEKNALIDIGNLPDISGAPILIHQLFYNIVQNALKFTKPGIPPVISISSRPSEENAVTSVSVTVRDNGIGLDEQYAEKIFTAFERLNSKDDFAGSGLGLAICRRIAERHKGTVRAHNIVSGGSEFTVTLPIAHKGKSI